MVEEVYIDIREIGKGEGITALEDLPEEVKDIMKKQPLNPFVKPEIKIQPLKGVRV